MIPKTLDEFVVWKLTAVNPNETLRWTDADIKRDAEHDLGKGLSRELTKTLKRLVAQGQIKKFGRHYQLPNKRVYTRYKPADIAPLELTEETKQMTRRMQSAARIHREQKKRMLQSKEVRW